MTRHMPFWLSPESFKSLRALLSSEELIKDNAMLENIRIELGVAKIRASSLTINTRFLTSALGLKEGSIPIYLNEEEKTALLCCEPLPEEIREILR
jgi:hypothetical protein